MLVILGGSVGHPLAGHLVLRHLQLCSAGLQLLHASAVDPKKGGEGGGGNGGGFSVTVVRPLTFGGLGKLGKPRKKSVIHSLNQIDRRGIVSGLPQMFHQDAGGELRFGLLALLLNHRTEPEPDRCQVQTLHRSGKPSDFLPGASPWLETPLLGI